MQMSKDGTMFITASKDSTAKLFDTDSLMCLKTYKTERPVNSAAVSPIFDHVSQFYFQMWICVREIFSK
jgi:translation initiation factor 3 subunit I